MHPSDTAKPATACGEPASEIDHRLGGEINQTNMSTESDRQRPITGDRVIQSLFDDYAVFDGLRGDIALEIVDRSFNRVMAAFRRDPRFAAISTADMELVLADAMREADFDIARHLDRHIDLTDLRDLAERGFPSDGGVP